MQRRTQLWFWYGGLAILAVLATRDLWKSAQVVEEIPYSEFQSALSDGRIAEVEVSGTTLRGDYKEPNTEGVRSFVTQRVPMDVVRELEGHGVAFKGVTENTLLRAVLSWVVPALAFLAIWLFLLKGVASKGAGGMLAIGKSKAKVYMETDTKVTFADVAGVDEALVELREVVEFLKDPARYGRLGARAPKGILLVGPPGTGKTLLARAVAGEAAVPFFSINGSEFVELFVGVGAARVRDLFDQARTKAPAIIFIDELDALGRVRGISAYGGGHDEKEQTLNQLLAELDGFDPSTGVVLLAATNRPEILDPALLRAGRFDRQVLVDRPDKAGRVAILAVHLKKIALAPEVDRGEIAALTAGFSGADLANLVNEAALLATRRGAVAVAPTDFIEAIERIVAGLAKRNRLLNPLERQIVAYHEMGHALVAMSVPGTDPVQKVSIIPRGIGSLGYTIQRPIEDRFLMTQEELESKLTVLLGGRAAEQLKFSSWSTGAADDLAKASEIARGMVARYGMDKRLGHATYETERSPLLGAAAEGFERRRFSEATARAIDQSVRAIVNAAFERAVAVLAARRELLEEGAKQLLLEETLERDDLDALRARFTTPENRADPAPVARLA
jgi:cell division protease FtsH